MDELLEKLVGEVTDAQQAVETARTSEDAWAAAMRLQVDLDAVIATLRQLAALIPVDDDRE